MKILHVITGLRKAAGTSVFCGEVCSQLAATGHKVTVAVVNPAEPDCYPLDSRVELVAIDSLLTEAVVGFNVVHIHALWSPVLH